MAVELPALTAIVARLSEPEINLAAYGGVVFPIALIIEAPIIMLLAASTALSKDLTSYQLVRRFMMTAGALLTLLHVLVAFTPLYYFIVEDILHVPQVVIEPARVGLMIMTPWTWSIAYRRFNQGVLIRFGRSKLVGVGTLTRLGANFIVLTVGYWIGTLPGIVVATCAVAAGVMSEALYSGIVVRPVRHGPLLHVSPVEPALSWNEFYTFYIPLALTSLITLLSNPIGSAAISRMPEALASLAVWPVVSGMLFLVRSPGIAYNEVVVALLDEPRSAGNLRRFALWLSAGATLALVLVIATPFAELYLLRFSALQPHLAELARLGLWLTLPLPALSVLQSWYQGVLLHSRRTRGITEAVLVYLFCSTILLSAGAVWGQVAGLYIGIAALTLATAIQTIWLWIRSRPALAQLG